MSSADASESQCMDTGRPMSCEVLQGKGLKLYFLPPYSPELNRIEKLWHKMKYEWMAFKSRDAQTLEADVDEILAGFGKKYKLDFC